VAAYLALALFVLRSVLPAPGRLLPHAALLDWSSTRATNLAQLDHNDQSMVASVVARNAALLTSEPWRLFSADGQCFPMPRGYTLGEHMFGTSLLAAPAYLLTRDPILSFNAALVLSLWIPALSMLALSYHFTRSPAAAFVAGLLFMLVPGRIMNPSHPYVYGDLWIPLVVLFLHRLFTRGRWSDAALLGLFFALEVFESLYPLLSCSLIVAVYGSVLALRHLRRLPALLPKLALAAGMVLLAVWLVLGPYLATRDTWGLLEGRTSLLMSLSAYGWGSIHFPGAMVLGLAAIGLADRLRGPRPAPGGDPRLPMLAAGLLVLWCATSGIPIPFTRVHVPSPLELLRPVVPGLSAVRALSAISITASLAWAFLAGYGVLRLIERRRARTAVVAAAAVTSLTLVFLYDQRFAKPMFSVRSYRLDAWRASPSGHDVALLRRVARGAVLDLPFPMMDTPSAGRLPYHLLLNAYDPRPTGACYNSFVSPVQQQVAGLSRDLPEHHAADALAALGFGTVVIDKGAIDAGALQGFYDRLRDLDNAARLFPVGKSGRLLVYRLETPLAVRDDFALLEGATAAPASARRDGASGRARVALELRNGGDAIFRLPDPIAPDDLLVRWRDDTGRVVLTADARALLPMALAPGARFALELEVDAPAAPGRWAVELARAAEPERVLATRSIDLAPS